MANYDIYHQDPLQRIMANDPGDYMRGMPQQPGMYPGMPSSGPEQQLSWATDPQREYQMKEMFKKWNPQFESMIEQMPSALQKPMRSMMNTGMGSAASKKFMMDNAEWQKYEQSGGTGQNMAVAADRMYSFSSGFNAYTKSGQSLMPTNPQDMVDRHNRGIEDTANLQRAMFTRIFKSADGKTTYPGGNPEYTNNMSPADAMNLASYQSRFGGRMAEGTTKDMSIEKKSEITNNKVQIMGAKFKAMGDFMKMMGSHDVTEALEQFKQLEGKEFGEVSPGKIIGKIQRASRLALVAHTSAKEVFTNMSMSQEMILGSMGRGEGSGYELGPRSEQGSSAAAVTRALATAQAHGISDPEVQKKMTELESRRTARAVNTTGGRALDLVNKMHMAGRLDDATYNQFVKRAQEGGNTGELLNDIQATTQLDIRGVMMDDAKFNATAENLNTEIRKKYGPRGEEMVRTTEEIRDRQINNKSDKEATGLRLGQESHNRRGQANSLKREYGVTFTDKQKQAQNLRAFDALKKTIAKNTDMSPEQKREYMNMVDVARETGQSPESLGSDLSRMGPEGRGVADTLRSAQATEETRAVQNSGQFKAGVGKTLLHEAGIALQRLTGTGLGEGNQEQQTASARKRLQAIINDPSASKAKKERAKIILGKFDAAHEAASKKSAAIDHSFKAKTGVLDTGEEAIGRGETKPETNYLERGESNKRRNILQDNMDKVAMDKNIVAGEQAQNTSKDSAQKHEQETEKKTDEQAKGAEAQRGDGQASAGKNGMTIKGTLKIEGMDEATLEAESDENKAYS